jgi:peptidoglycan/LPS O-acetylase OafA/YrhL
MNAPARQFEKPSEPATTEFMPQLDGLRAIAIALVFVHHTPFGESFPIPLGGLAVRLFFVLSGFLITGILLSCRAHVEQRNSTAWRIARQFYVRRFLRIFPLYYFVIACAVLLDFGNARQDCIWLLTYGTNILVSINGSWNAFGHFWSLAVEEHFYLLWPWLVLFLPIRAIFPVTLLVIFSGSVYRLFALTQEYNMIAIYCATPACFDALGFGALLAILRSQLTGPGADVRHLRRILVVVGMSGLGLAHLSWLIAENGIISTIFTDFFLAMCFFCLVDAAAMGFTGKFGNLLSMYPVLYLGKISYGVYVYHPFVPSMLQYSYTKLGINRPVFGFLDWMLVACITIGLAAASWIVFESPLNRLKKHFPYLARK